MNSVVKRKPRDHITDRSELFLQTNGHLKGVVRSASGTPVASAVVIITNQVTRETNRTRTNADGSYSLQLRAGAYRVTLDQPHIAQFEKDKNYGDFAIVRGDTLENVIIEAGKGTVVDIPVAPPAPEGQATPQSLPQKRETRDRWRIRFPDTIVMAIAELAAATSLSSVDAGGILTTRTSSKATTRSKAISFS